MCVRSGERELSHEEKLRKKRVISFETKKAVLHCDTDMQCESKQGPEKIKTIDRILATAL